MQQKQFNQSFLKVGVAVLLLLLGFAANGTSHSVANAGAFGIVSAGTAHTCAVTSGGGAKCWGFNQWGQLGNGTTTNSNLPVDVCADATCASALSGAIGISAGDRHSCALMTGGGVKCWGYNGVGALGNGSTTSSNTPVNVCADTACATILTSATAVSAGTFHTCALAADGAKCWGNNAYGQVGDGSGTTRTAPVNVCAGVGCAGALSGVTNIVAGFAHTCAVSSGAAKCWGSNDFGQLGDGTNTQRNVPTEVTGLSSGIATVSAAYRHSCAVLSSGGVKCWGGNSNGQLGNGTSTTSTTAVDVCADSACASVLSGATKVSAGGYHTCALLSGGGIKCWGWNGYGQLGNGNTTASTTPLNVCADTTCVSALSNASSVSAGDYHTCAVLTTGVVKCWGYNDNGRLGNGTTTNSSTPVQVSGLSTPTAVTLITFRAKFIPNKSVRVKWETGNELNVVGFNVWKQVGKGGWKIANPELIPAKQIGTVNGAKYAFKDKQVKPGKTYRYKIELVMANGASEWSDVKSIKPPKKSASATPTPASATPTPASATLAAFAANYAPKTNLVRVKWATGNETNVVGFNVWRQTGSGEWELHTKQRIKAKHAGSAQSAKYAVKHKQVRAGETYQYKLEIVTANGASEWSEVKTVKLQE